ncbi:MAG: hypothetical protein HXS41_06250 [Theionarchaea archaeon]|nr:hypothetical protein [Theionarchaea archaeon]MBU7000358.1 hypothetical protein [Theionarchaea archaeon]MBU7020640.1 hypothetical protein [Theionarchaea archaeon]MBU7036107.1 hypothetical protein [Theionarchaea archaeon]MBU7040420.1 hypothetical protein [Theionarchaea archaeon]
MKKVLIVFLIVSCLMVGSFCAVQESDQESPIPEFLRLSGFIPPSAGPCATLGGPGGGAGPIPG